MVKCTNGISVIEVTEGAYNDIFKAQGYVPVDEKKAKKEKTPEKVEEPEEVDEESVVKEPEVDPFDELEAKPISSWSKTEVKEYAEAKGIDLSGTKNVNEAKDRIKAVLQG